ncbi:hypothetical protein M409DRAFT_66988 [Zasmidium cellare ATCC 36951]|uniref:C2H2-type domain-containing protein n=1 Tax=Zasmidium cellare ATCC 36951 TaxID=1080233 RepID=A0A6A6CFV8_ZASCE|nr:uncharacterized protein M409DRAFT_66988 [Zasmidium cellare ATCC 36951]KAF2166127.1 hypothetical protein M409DRAFT_66988 [Zasmidium cellare ATCC 36951]
MSTMSGHGLKASKRDYTAHRIKLKQHGRHKKPNAVSTELKVQNIAEWWQRHRKFFQWLVDQNKKGPQQSVTLLGYFRILKMVYVRLTDKELDLQVVRDVNNYIRYHLEGKKKDSPRPKSVPSGEDFVKMLHYHYARDRDRYDNERQRVQQAFLMIIHGSSGVRPSSTMRTHVRTGNEHQSQEHGGERKDESGDEVMEVPEEDSEFHTLRYRDLELSAVRTQNGVRYMVRPKFRHFKGGERRAQNKTFSWLDQDDILTCPVAHLVALAPDDRAFKVAEITPAQHVLQIGLAQRQNQLVFHWRDDIKDKPIMRTGSSLDADEVSDGMALKRLSSLGKNTMGYKESLTWYCIRRMVLNKIDHIGSDETRNQISGHFDSRTYRAHYMDQQIGIDVIAAVRGHRREEDIIEDVNSMGSSADTNANRQFSTEDRAAIEQTPEVVEARVRLQKTSQAVLDAYGSIARGRRDGCALFQEYESATKQYRAVKQRMTAQRQSRRRQAYFEARDNALIEAQLGGHAVPSFAQPMEEEIYHRVPERAFLAGLATCLKTQCLFCLGDEMLSVPDRQRQFSKEYTMQKHTEHCHLKKLYQFTEIPCPHPYCRQTVVTLRDVQHLKSHAQVVHGAKLRKSRV